MYLDLLPPRVLAGLARFDSRQMIWRAPCLLASQTEKDLLLGALRSRGAIVSDHYFSMAMHLADSTCVNADEVSLRAVNFLVDDFVSDSHVEMICAIARQILS
jgi:hypothetical protein